MTEKTCQDEVQSHWDSRKADLERFLILRRIVPSLCCREARKFEHYVATAIAGTFESLSRSAAHQKGSAVRGHGLAGQRAVSRVGFRIVDVRNLHDDVALCSHNITPTQSSPAACWCNRKPPG